MPNLLRYTLFLLPVSVASGCGPSEYRLVEPTPVLAVSLATTTCEAGGSITGRLRVTQEGTDGSYSLSAILREGALTVTADDAELPLTGQWHPLNGNDTRLRIIPETAGRHVLVLQAMSSDGTRSNECEATLTVQQTGELRAKAHCEAELCNIPPETMIPITLTMEKAGHVGRYRVVATLLQGSGRIFHKGNAVTGVETELEACDTLYFRPEALGEQVFEFSVTAGTDNTVIRAYTNIVEELTIRHADLEGFSVTGAGRYDTEGATATLTLENADGYNFEAAGWYDASGKLLSTENDCPVRLTLGGVSEIVLELKKREVRLETKAYERVATQYYVPSTTGNNLESQQAYDYRLRLTADYRLSDDLVFVYELCKHDVYQNQTFLEGQPSLIRGEAHPKFPAGASASEWFWDYYHRFAITLRQSDNPTLKFDRSAHTVESATARYLIPENINL
ncbi:MAG: hypothetical protein NC548_32575 [Lachnospiraceae bacterium]|nr:hypothetical protein [Lachnospiraceae bacterium]